MAMDFLLVNLIDGLATGLMLFMLSSGLTLIFSMMGVLNFAHASFYMLGAYFGWQIGQALGFWWGLLLAPPLVGAIGALVQRHGLRRVHRFGHVPELVFTFGLAMLIEEAVKFVWGQAQLPHAPPEALQFAVLSIAGNAVPAYRLFMIGVALAIFLGLLWVATRTRTGLIIQAALSHPRMVEALGHDVPTIFTAVFGVGTALAALAGVIAGPVMGTFPGMAVTLGPIVFVTIVIGGLGSLWGALAASLLMGWVMTFAAASDLALGDIAAALGLPVEAVRGLGAEIAALTLPRIGPLLPYLLMILVLVLRPGGLFGKRRA